MPIYEMKLPGQEKPRLIKAKDVATALAGVVDIKPINAERLIELQSEGVKLEIPADATDPASHAPGGALHNAAGGDAVAGKSEAAASGGSGKGEEKK